jgi:hypothetical protein
VAQTAPSFRLLRKIVGGQQFARVPRNSRRPASAAIEEGKAPMARKAGNKIPATVPPSLPPEKALELLRRQVEKGKQLLANRPISSAAAQAWETTTRDVLIRTYGSGSGNVESVMGVGQFRYAFGGGNEQEWEAARAEDVQGRLTIMAELIDLLEHEVGPQPAPTPAASAVATPVDDSNDLKPMTAFISYSWDNEAHKSWVRGLADQLQRNGIQTILDQYDLEIGQDRFRFMETSVRKAGVVLCVCTPDYVERANERQKGVGVETSLITPRFFEENKAKQFIPIIRVKNVGASPTPDYMAALIFVDFSNDADFSLRMEELLRHLHRQPKVKKPPLGPVPSFGSSPPSSTTPPPTVPAGSPSITDILNTIIRSNKADWQYFDERGLFVFKTNPEIAIRRREADHDVDGFREAWTESFPDPAAYRCVHEVLYKNTPIQEAVLVAVDGNRMYLPLPQSPVDLTITPQQYAFSKLVNQFTSQLERFHEYLRRAGITVSK